MTALDDTMRAAIRSQLVASPKVKDCPNRHRLTGPSIWNRSYASDALGCSPDQIAESTAYLRSHGITADFDSEGRLVITSEKQYQDCATAFGLRTGRDGYDVKNNEGNPILTGRQQAEGREKFKEQLRRMCENPHYE